MAKNSRRFPRPSGPDFYPPAGEFALAKDVEHFWYTPVARNAILFPAYFFHHTIPTGTPESRITIAFDVVANEAI